MENRRANRERDILNASARLFRERGYSATTVDDIAADVGCNKAMLYYYFANKAGILYHLYLATIEDLYARLDAADMDLSPDAALTAVIEAVVEAITGQPDYIAVFFQELQWLETWLPSEEFDDIRRRQREFLDTVQKIIERGMADGVFHPLEPRLAVSSVIGTVGWIYKWYGSSASYTSDELKEALVSFALRGLMARPDEPSGRRPTTRRSGTTGTARSEPTSAKGSNVAKPSKAAGKSAGKRK